MSSIWLKSCCSVAVVSNSLQPHELQHARLPCPSVSPGVCSNSCPLSRWCYLPSTTTRIKSRAVAAADLQYSGGRSPGWREGVRHSVLGGVGERTVPIGLRIAWYFQKLILWAQFLYLPISRRALKSFMAMTAPHHEQKPSAKCMCLIACIPLRQNHIFTDLSPYFFGAVSQSYLKCYLPRHSSHFAPNKT